MFEWNGKQYTLEQVDHAAQQSGMNIDEYINANNINKVKTSPTNQSAFVEPGTALNMGSRSGNIFLDSQEDDEEYGLLTSLAARTARGFVSAAKGISSLVDGIKFGIYNMYNPDMTADEKIAVKADIERGFTDDLEGAEEWLSQFTQRTESESVLDAIKKGDYGDAAELIVGGALESLPSIVAAFTGYGGIALFGASVAGNKFDEEFDRNPDEALGRLAFNSVGSGAIEAGFEIATRGLLKQAGFIASKSGTAQAKKFLEKGAATMVKKVGYGFTVEGASEASTEITQILFDGLDRDLGGLGRKTDMGEAITRVFDAGAIGGFVGGTISTAGQVKTNAAKERAEYALMVPSMKSELVQTGLVMSKLAKQIPESDAKGKKLIQEEIEFLEDKAQRIKNKNSLFLDRLSNNRPEFEEYAANIELINEQASIFRNKENPEDVRNLAMERAEGLKEQNDEIVKRVNEMLIEQSIEKTQKAASKLDRVSLTAFETKKEKDEESKKRKINQQSIISETADGVIFQNPDGSQEIFLDKETMLENNVIDAAEHELFHALLYKTFINNEGLASEFGSYLEQEINKLDQKAISKVKGSEYAGRIQQYKSRIAGEVITGKRPIQEGKDILGDEILALFSDAVRRGDVKYEETVFTKIEDFIRRILQNIGYSNIQFDNSRDVFNFIRDYNVGIAKGGIRGSMLKGAVEGFAGKIVKGKRKADKAAIEKFSVSETGQRLSREVQEIYEEKGEAGAAEIISRFGPIIDRLVKSRKGVAGFDYELLRTELEYGLGTVNKEGETKLRSILGLIRDYNPETGVPLAAYINTRIYQRLIEASRKILKENYDVDVGSMTSSELEGALSEGAPVDYDTAVEESEDLIDPLKELVADEALVQQIQEEIINNFNIEDLPNLTYANLKDLAPKLTKQIFGETTDERLQFVLDNAETLHALLPLAAMQRAAGDKGLKTSTKIEGSVLSNFYVKGGRKDMPAGGTAAGLPIQAKIPFDENQWNDLFGSDPSIGRRNQRETLLPKLMNEIGRAITNSVIRHHLLNSGIENANKAVPILADGKSRQLYSESSERENKYILKLITQADKTLGGIGSIPKNRKWGKNITKKWVDRYKETHTQEELETVLRHLQPSVALYKKGDWEKNLGKIPNFFEGANMEFWEEFKHLLPEGQEKVKSWKVVGFKDERIREAMFNPETGTMDLDRITKDINSLEVGELLFDATVDFLQYAVDNGATPNQIYLLAASLHNSYNSIFKLAARFTVSTKFTGKDFKAFQGEHLTPSSFALARIITIIKKYGSKSKKGKKLIQDIKNDYHMAVIPKSIAEEIDKKGASKTLVVHEIGKGSALKRITDYSDQQVEFDDRRPVKTGVVQKLSISRKFNKILEDTKGVAKDKIVGDIDAVIYGRKNKRSKILPYSAEDFEGLIYHFLGKGKQGDQHYEFFEETLFTPLTEAQMQWDAAKLESDKKLIQIKKEIRKAGVDLSAQVKSETEPELEKYTYDQVIRSFIWIKQGTPPVGMDIKEQAAIFRLVRTDLGLAEFRERIQDLYSDGFYPVDPKTGKPPENWLASTLLFDLLETWNGPEREYYFNDFWTNSEEIFGKFGKGGKLTGDNINKIRSIYGDNFVDALENMLARIKTGRNRTHGPDEIAGKFMNWTNDAVGTIMFFNTRSALLQMISFANFINWSDNNFAAATARWIDQPQFWKDFAMIFNSDFLKSRRKGLRTDVNADDIANAAAGSKNKAKGALSSILKLGFLPTQIADSAAIALGGASFYRNRVTKYIKDGLKESEAEKKAFIDLQKQATAAQQSALPWRVSKQQAGPLGRVILAFQNTPMQYTRLIKKSVMDLINNRGDWKTNMSKIAYYSAIQNVIFHGLQSAMFAMLFADEEDEERKKRYQNLGNRMADTLLIGTGVYGAIAATTKNVILEVIDQEKSGRRDFEKAALKSTSLSPPINSKLQKLLRASRRFQYKQEREKIQEMGLTTQNPAVISAGEILSAVFNLPADRAIRKWNNLVKAADSETELWQSIALAMGYSEWDVKLMDNQKEPTMNTGLKKKKFGKLND